MVNQMKRYRCPNNHVLGLIVYSGHNVARLLYFRDALDENAEVPPEVHTTAIIDSGDVTCSICNASITWVPSAPTLARLIRSHKKLMV